ncbi:MAG: DUF1616 domain-containing protein [Nitrososphaerota archaeon]|jgi:uncharacterized membrane protein|nr:DUF1616 domain-containing protein [Nitrososphaerota archaeon]
MLKLSEIRKIGLDEEKGYVVAIFLALIIVAAVVAGYYLLGDHTPEEYNTISLLNHQKQATEYPEIILTNHTSEFSVYVNVENHMNTAQNYIVHTKITKNLPANFPNGLQVDPTDTYKFSLSPGETHQKLVTVTEDTPGNYAVVFELWRDSGTGIYMFTRNYCSLNIQVK